MIVLTRKINESILIGDPNSCEGTPIKVVGNEISVTPCASEFKRPPMS